MSQTYRKFLNDKYTLKFLSKDYEWVELPEDFRLPEKYVYVVTDRETGKSKCCCVVGKEVHIILKEDLIATPSTL